MKIKQLVVASLIASASLSYAVDNMAMPVESQAKEAYLSLGWASYDNVSLQHIGPGFKFGLAPNIELGIEVPLLNVSPEQGSSTFGLDQIIIGGKFRFTPGAAAFVDFNLPFGSKKIVGSNPTLNTELGFIIDQSPSTIMHLRGEASYTWYPEDKDKYDRGNMITVELRPGYKLSSTLEAFADVTFLSINKSAYAGTDEPDSDNWYALIGPGVLANIDNTTKVEGFVDFLLLKDTDPGLNWVLNLQVNKQF